uniref:Ovule protein n=1 Tax=Haemonchus placei TaxID=6290 RepID=A0A0N4VVY6_HAEPC
MHNKMKGPYLQCRNDVFFTNRSHLRKIHHRNHTFLSRYHLFLFESHEFLNYRSPETSIGELEVPSCTHF